MLRDKLKLLEGIDSIEREARLFELQVAEKKIAIKKNTPEEFQDHFKNIKRKLLITRLLIDELLLFYDDLEKKYKKTNND